MLAIDVEAIQKKRKSFSKKLTAPRRTKSGSSKDSRASSKRRSSKDFAAMFDDCDKDDILELVKELKQDAEGQKMLKEFVDYQTGKSTQKPRLLELALEDDSNGSDELPFTEIVIGGPSCDDKHAPSL